MSSLRPSLLKVAAKYLKKLLSNGSQRGLLPESHLAASAAWNFVRRICYHPMDTTIRPSERGEDRGTLAGTAGLIVRPTFTPRLGRLFQREPLHFHAHVLGLGGPGGFFPASADGFDSGGVDLFAFDQQAFDLGGAVLA